MFKSEIYNFYTDSTIFKLKLNTDANENFRNLSDSPFKLKKTIVYHTNWVTKVCLLKDKRIASSSWDCTIRIFNLEKDECDIVIKGPNHAKIMQLSNEYIVAGFWDGLIKIYEVNKKHYQCIKTLDVHKDMIHEIAELDNKRFGTCSSDSKLIIWSSSAPFNIIHIIQTNSVIINLIQLKYKEYLVYGNEELLLSFANSSNYKVEKEVKDITTYTNDGFVELKNQKLVIIGKESTNIFNLETFQLELKIMDLCFGNCFTLGDLNNKYVIIGYKNDIIFIEKTTFKCEYILRNAHRKKITSLVHLGNGEFSSSSLDKTIKIWKVPECIKG